MRNTGIVLNTNIASPQNGFQVAFHNGQSSCELFVAMLGDCAQVAVIGILNIMVLLQPLFGVWFQFGKALKVTIT